jgi:hypothetical protein
LSGSGNFSISKEKLEALATRAQQLFPGLIKLVVKFGQDVERDVLPTVAKLQLKNHLYLV